MKIVSYYKIIQLIYYSSDPEVASVSENELRIHKIGSVTITATQSGNADFYAAPDVARLLAVDSVAETELVTGIEKNLKTSFDVIVRENPFGGSLKFQVNSDYQSAANIVLYTMKGERIHESLEQTNTTVEYQLDFKPGIYLLGVQTDQGRKVMKVLCMD